MVGEAGIHLGNYSILFELASGGMATVYVAKQSGAGGFERLVIIKRVHRHLLKIREFIDMFCDEARVASLIRHPNVVSADDVVKSADELFLVQPYVESVALDQLLEAAHMRGERLAPAVVARIITDALEGLSAAHDVVDMRGNRLDLVHRDVSPHNVLVGSDGRSRIIDFGIAKAAGRITSTTGGAIKGKLAYLAPEQVRQEPVDARMDLFAMGVVLYESLTGAPLFRGDDQAGLLFNVLLMPIPQASQLVKDVSPELDAVVKKALERERADRYQSAPAFVDGLAKAVSLAGRREVAQLVERLCGPALEERREAIRACLDDPRTSEIPRPSRISTVGNDVTLAAGPGSDPAGSRSTGGVAMVAKAIGKSSIPPPMEGSPRSSSALRGAIIALAVVGIGGVAWMAVIAPRLVVAGASEPSPRSEPASAPVSASPSVPASVSVSAPVSASPPSNPRGAGSASPSTSAPLKSAKPSSLVSPTSTTAAKPKGPPRARDVGY